MKWITREHVKVDRVACPWLIKKFVDKDAEFVFAPADKVMAEAKRLDAIPYDVKDVELGHHGKECSFEAILKKYELTGDAALVLLGRIVNGADTDNTLYHQAEGPGLHAVAEGFRHLGYKDDHEVNAAEWIVYDALYAYAKEMVKPANPRVSSPIDSNLCKGGSRQSSIANGTAPLTVAFAIQRNLRPQPRAQYLRSIALQVDLGGNLINDK